MIKNCYQIYWKVLMSLIDGFNKPIFNLYYKTIHDLWKIDDIFLKFQFKYYINIINIISYYILIIKIF